VTGKDRGRYR